MKALVLSEIGKIEYKDVKDPVLKSGKCLIKPMAFGICGSDIPRIYKTGAHVHPIIPGHEFSGIVVETAGGSLYKSGDRVAVFPLIPCEKCRQCKEKKYEMCENYSYLGSRCDGGFAELVAVPESNLLKLPENVSFEAAAMAEPMAVAAHAVRRATESKDKDSTVFVQGLGTIGLLTVIVLKTLGFNDIYVVGNKQFQRDTVLSLGVNSEHYIDASSLDINTVLKVKSAGHGADIVFECVGKSESYEDCISVCAPSGVVMLVGNPASDMTLSRNAYWIILRHQLTVLGTWNSSFTGEENDDWHFVMKLLSAGKIDIEKLITHRFELKDLMEGFEIMRDKKEDYIKVMGVSR